MTALAGAEVSFARAAGLLSGLAGVTISARTIERSAEATGAAARAAADAEATAILARQITVLPPPAPVPGMPYVEVDGTGVPMRASETEERAGQDGAAGPGPAGKLARLFTVSRLDENGRPVMDPGFLHLRGHLRRQGRPRRAGGSRVPAPRRRALRQFVALGDGAAWIWTMAGALYPHATYITDIYHAREHLNDLASHLAFITPDPAQWLADRNAELDAGTSAPSSTPPASIRSKASRPASWTRNWATSTNAHRMRYADFRKLGMFIGSGHIEGGIKAIVAQRAKQSGMHWTVKGAEDIISLRCQHASGRWNDFVAPAAPGPAPGLRAAI